MCLLLSSVGALLLLAASAWLSRCLELMELCFTQLCKRLHEWASGVWDFFPQWPSHSGKTNVHSGFSSDFLVKKSCRFAGSCRRGKKNKPPAPKTPLYSTEVPTFEPPGNDKALLIGALCNVIIPSLFVIQNNSLGAIYHLIYSGGYHVPAGFCIMVRRWNKFQTIAGCRRAEKAARGAGNPKVVQQRQKIVRIPGGKGWRV